MKTELYKGEYIKVKRIRIVYTRIGQQELAGCRKYKKEGGNNITMNRKSISGLSRPKEAV